MITASHNGKEYNGIKMCLNKESVWGQQIQAIKAIYHKKVSPHHAPRRGAYSESPMVHIYVAWLAEQFDHLKNMSLSAVVDCGNGAAGAVMPLLCKTMGWDNVLLLYSDIDGNYPHHDADPTKEENMRDVATVLLSTDIQVGIGLDGDADRMAPMTKAGELVLGDKMLALFAQSIVVDQPDLSVVYDIKCSSGLPEALQAMGVTPYVSPTGHSIIKKNMKIRTSALAGELSCHFFFADRYFGYDDGVYAMLRLFDILQKADKPLDELLAIFPRKVSTSEIRFACAESQQELVMEKVHEYFTRIAGAHIMTLDGIRVELYNGWGILRPSNTQPVLCARFEADTQENLMRIKELFIQGLENFYERSYLQTIF
jgi:phosphomannomutase/phosphoglucomutase